ncbi:substrate-binding domain-containing protein [Falsihalocynthiibacter sp. SS001]|uniref:substrate-binding domain-containing protein n=1 Tax=Falsihalocynthiibacter sp. SS001 TaxID=3349698 RepID=UPI0036D2D454
MKKLVSAAALCAAITVPTFAAAEEEPVDITMIIYASAGVPFFQPLELGANTAAELLNVNLDIQYAQNDVVRQNNVMETALANGVDGLLVEIWDDNAFDEAVCDAIENGTPVVSFNIDDSEGADGNCRMAFVGQNFVDAGYTIGKRMIADHGIGEGDVVFTPVEYPEAAYAVLRHSGVQKALEEVGAKADLVGVTDRLPEVLTAMTQYLIGNSDIKAIIGLGQQPMMMAQQALDETGMNVPIGGFDVAPEILDGIASGRITATVDQQPYSQGYYSVAQMAHYIRYGLYPADLSTGGSGLIDKSNYEAAVALAGKTR